MAQHDPQVIALRRLREQFAEDRDRFLMPPEPRQYRGAKETRVGIGRRRLQPLLDLLQRLRISLTLDQDAHEIQPCGDIAWRTIDHFAKIVLGLRRCAVPLRHPAEQAQRLHVLSITSDVARQKVFRRAVLAVAEQAARLDNGGRQFMQFRQMLRGDARSLQLAGRSQQVFKPGPARRKGRIERDRTFERLDRAPRIAQCDMALTALMEKQAVVRMRPLKGSQCL